MSIKALTWVKKAQNTKNKEAFFKEINTNKVDLTGVEPERIDTQEGWNGVVIHLVRPELENDDNSGMCLFIDLDEGYMSIDDGGMTDEQLLEAQLTAFNTPI